MNIYEQCKTEVKQQTQSKLESVLLELDKKDAESLKEALLDETIPSRAIARVLEQNSIECGVWAINQWRKKSGVRVYSSSMTRGAAKK
jgi:hypothetical protein